ncbi:MULTISPECIES: DUF4468 domain-containing protein [Prevotellaceae]|uniref:DUF4468 domain-containing protein n=1 Tax=Prevotellaceae TaxID=171552 RepID=UPI0003D2EB3A|nr:DUF4468 domain-containing protein [Prevotella phocaeensis]ETD21699.1 hypothetical protein HMPREF1199_00029 [Hoylesella oralis CC98A]
MKKLILAAMLLMPLFGNAQSVLTPQEQLEKAKKEAEAAKQAVKEAKKQAKLAAKKAKIKNEDIKNAAINEEIKKAKAETERYKAEAEKYKIEAEKQTKLSTAPSTNNTNGNAGWTVPQSSDKGTAASNRTSNNSTTTKTDWKHDPKYLTGAVPQNAEGKVVFTLDIDVPGKNAQQIYDIVYAYLNNMAQEDGQQASRIVLVNQDKGIIVAKYTEWLTFSESFLALDRTLFNYTIIGTCTDNHLQLTLDRISYDYERGRPSELKSSAENYITDKYALNKKQTGLINGPAKFRRKTIDRKNQIFENIVRALQ